MLSAALLNGKDLYAKIVRDLPAALEKYGFKSIEEVKATKLGPPPLSLEPSFPVIDKEKCTGCRRCADGCPYFAMTMEGRHPAVNTEKCFGCGLCESRCPAGAISKVIN